MCSTFETDVFEDITIWAYDTYKSVSPDDVSTTVLVDDYWVDYIASCAMSQPKDGMELIQ